MKVTMEARLVACAALLTACGGSPPTPAPAGSGANAAGDGTPRTGTDAPTEVPMNFAVATQSALPACDASRKDALVYVQDSQSLTYCDGAAWKPATIKSAPARIEATIYCTGVVTGSIWGAYGAAITTAGDVFVTGSVRNGAIEASNSVYYSATQNGALTAAVNVQFDLMGAANSGFWVLSLDRQTLVHTLRYVDSDAVGGEQIWSLTPDKCIKTVSP